MKILIFKGYSDDTFGEYGFMNIDHDNCGSGKPITFQVSAKGKSVFVTGQYSRFGSGMWGIDVVAENEDELPDWDMKLSFEGYSAILTMAAPDDVVIEYIKR